MQTGCKPFFKALLDLCFPPVCLGCKKSLSPGPELQFCETCAAQIKFISEPFCPRCGLGFPHSAGGNHLCSACLENVWSFSLARSLAYYAGPLVNALQSFKYGGKTTGLASFQTLKKIQPITAALFDPNLIVPVPLHPDRLRERGFNQALLLAEAFFPDLKNRISSSLLTRSKWTAPQTTLSGSARRKNLKNSFHVDPGKNLTGKKILLVDDVFTTGTTVNECARVLVKAGAYEVQVLTLARTGE